MKKRQGSREQGAREMKKNGDSALLYERLRPKHRYAAGFTTELRY
jgi:hypothetical protein